MLAATENIQNKCPHGRFEQLHGSMDTYVRYLMGQGRNATRAMIEHSDNCNNECGGDRFSKCLNLIKKRLEKAYPKYYKK